MRVISKDSIGSREVRISRTAGSQAVAGLEGARTYVCGSCRDILAKNVSLGRVALDGPEPDYEPLRVVADLVIKCKNCGSFNDFGVSETRRRQLLWWAMLERDWYRRRRELEQRDGTVAFNAE